VPDSKLSALPSGAAISDADLFYSDQSAASVSQSASAFATYILTKLPTFLRASNNLSDVANVATARSNLGVATSAIEFVIDGGGATITTGMKGYVVVPFACTITQSTLLADQSGSIVVNVYRCTYAQFDAGTTHPVAADKITASAPPTISSATKAQDSTLTGWTTAINAGDILAFNVDSVSTVQRVTIALSVTRS
jgi:hypothetical protein